MFNYNYMPRGRYIFTYSCTLVSHGLSVFGSASICYLILKDIKKRSEVYHRLVLGMSLADVIFSALNPLQALLLPHSTNLPFSIGNTRTCEFMGVLTVVWLAAIIYNAILCVYFLLTVRYGKRQLQVKAIIEPYGHVVAIGVPIIVAAASLATNVFNPEYVFGICIMAPYPPNCLADETVECERGKLYPYGLILHNGINVLIGGVGIASTWLVFWTVRQQETRNRRYSFTETLKHKQSQAVAQQAIMYTMAFLNTMLAGAIFVTLSWLGTTNYYLENPDALRDNYVVYAFVLIFYCLAPLQGFLNWLVYIRPRWLPWRDAHPQASAWWVYQQILAGRATPVTRPTQHLLAVDSPSSSNDNVSLDSIGGVEQHPQDCDEEEEETPGRSLPLSAQTCP